MYYNYFSLGVASPVAASSCWRSCWHACCIMYPGNRCISRCSAGVMRGVLEGHAAIVWAGMPGWFGKIGIVL